MLQRYKVRLGDGTVLQVDLDGLRAWLEDRRATVQVAGTQDWRPLREVLADEESAARLAKALVPPEPRRALAPSPPELSPSGPPPELSIGAPPLVQALADEPAAPEAPAPPWRESPEPAGEAPVIRLKPLDDAPPSAPYATPSARQPEDDWKATDWEGEREPEERPHDRLEGPLLQVLSTLGNLLSRCLDPLTPLVRGSRPGPASARRKEAPPVAPPRVSVLAEEPGEPLDEEQRLEEGEPWRVSLSRKVAGWSADLTGWVSGLTARVGRLRDESRPEPLLPPGEAVSKRPPAPAPREPLAPPVPLKDLPPLRLVEPREESEEEDVYEGETAESILPIVWLWTKRVVLWGALATGVVLAVVNRATWFPRAAEMGQTVFTEIDRQARSGQRAREQEQALRDATERLPHLAPATIRLVLATSSNGVLEPPEVFQLANDAADRGRSALTSAEEAELRSLQRELVGRLRPPERARLAEYDRARSQRVVFPFENPYALELVARAARALPASSRERLQALLGKAVAAGLAVPGASPGAAPAGPGVAR